MEIGKSDPNWNRGWFLTHAFSPKLHNGLEDMDPEFLKWTADLGSKVSENGDFRLLLVPHMAVGV